MNLNATLVIEVLSFLILLGLLIKFLYRPVLNILDRRAEEIKEMNQKIQGSLASAEREHSRAEQLLAETKSEALKLREKAREDAELARQKTINQTKDEASRILRAGQQEIVNETKKAREKIKGEIVNLSLKVAEKILRREFTPKDQERLIKELTKGIDNGRGASGR